MRLSDLFTTKAGQPVLSFEFSRPKTDKAAASLEKALDKLTAAEPDYVSVTFGAGGSTREGSFELVEALKSKRQLPTVAYLAAVGLGPDDLIACLDRFKAIGIETIFVIRGDAPTWEDNYKAHPEALSYASDLIGFIKAKGYDFCLGAAAYPEKHLEAESLDKDIEAVKIKVDQGAEYLVAQYFYDNQYFFDFMDKLEAAGIKVPVVPGVMPIYTEKMMENLARVCGATITPAIREGLAALPDEKGAVGQFGIEFATEQCRGLLKHGVKGLHFYTMNRFKATTTILATLRAEGLL